MSDQTEKTPLDNHARDDEVLRLGDVDVVCGGVLLVVVDVGVVKATDALPAEVPDGNLRKGVGGVVCKGRGSTPRQARAN